MSNPYNSTPSPNGQDRDGLNLENWTAKAEQSFLNKRLHRSHTDKYVAGVLGGIAETYNINSTLVRLLFLASMMLPGPQILMYLVMWVVMPRD